MLGATIISYLSSLVFHLVFFVVLFIIADLSRIMGVALKKKPLYKLMYPAYALLALGQVFFFLGTNFRIYTYGFDATSLLLGCAVTFYYWKWLPRDLSGG
jgi:hypothetical protein